ncbi:aspartic peptidase domain-containing protein [Dactylonectria estremocensis]|uniref:Probable aspartic-type endopeptidase OPSB n=1 Tax=Dactylonectria estremocensis TaxID=1079267 RepID=A0A9P9FDX7_9HYPO|nr:aspartic peptidase domain-containing protein [Dactylonectria estremocensis]
MRPVHLLIAITASVIPTSLAISLHKRQDGIEPRVLSLDLQRHKIQDPISYDRNRQRRRSGSVDVDIDNEVTLYYFNASLGTPKQELRLHLDTGSSDLWVNSPDSTLCSTTMNLCAEAGTYDANSSSTYEYVGSYFNISYVDGSGAAGDYATDTFRVGDTKISNLQFGVGYKSSSNQGVLGIGYGANEVQAGVAGKSPYKNLPARMAADGLIASNAYSLWLNDLSSETGTILFGGVDRARYEGDLVSVPIQKNGGEYSSFFITLTSLSIGSTAVGDNLALAVLLDSGSTLSYLPESLTDTIYDKVGAEYDESQGIAFVPCSLANEKGNLTFEFSDPAEIVVPISEMVIDYVQITGQQLSFSDGTAACMFGIAPSSGTNILGDTFLRSAFVVFDLENNEISLAQSNYNATTTDIVEIGSGESAVPSTTAAENPVSAQSGVVTVTEAGSSGATTVSPSISSWAWVGVVTLVLVFAGSLA